MAARRVLFADPRIAAGLGLAALAAAWVCLHDAYDGRGRPLPRILRPFTWW